MTVDASRTDLRRALHLLGSERRIRWVMLIVIALVASGFEIVGAALVFALLGLVSGEQTGVQLPLLGDLRELVDLPEETFLLAVAIVMAVFFLARATVHVLKIYVQNRVVQHAGARLARRLLEGYLALPYDFHLRRNSSEVIRNVDQAAGELATKVYMPLITISAESLLVLSMLTFLVVLAPGASVLAIAVIGVAAIILLRVVQPRLKILGRRAHRSRRETLNTLQQSLQGIRDIKLLGREADFARVYGRSRMTLARSNYLASTAHSLPAAVMELALLGVVLSVFGYAVLQGTATQEALPVLGLFAYAGLRLQPSLQKIINGVNELKYASAPLEDIYNDLRLMESHRSEPQPTEGLPFDRNLVLRDVAFRYEGADVDALSEANLTITPGEVIGVCGATGGGKSTLVDLIAGLIAPTSGSVTVDGVDLRRQSRAWQSTLGVVSQAIFLTDQSFRENIALGVAPQHIDDLRVAEAVRLAQLEEFVASLPDGLETVVGERGIRVSGGQRQRIAIARALYRDPSVIIFDEGTSALDNTTERELIAALERLRGERTIIMVAHRLSTVRIADRIVYVEAGRLAGVGSFEELSRSHAGFQRLAST